MLNNFKTWIQNTAISIVDDTTINKKTSSSTGTSPINNTLKLNNNLNQSTSSLSLKLKNNLRCNHSNRNSYNDSQSISEIDLSHFSREEKEHIEYVIKKAEEDFIISENFLEMKRKSKTNSDTGLNNRQSFHMLNTKNNLSPNSTVNKYSSSTSSLSSMSSCFSQNDHQTTSTPDEPNKTIKFNSTDTTKFNINLSNEHLLSTENEKLLFKKNSNLDIENQQKIKTKRKLPSTPSFMNNNTNSNNQIGNAMLASLPIENTSNDNKNVTEWLKKSFEQTKNQLLNEKLTTNNNNNNSTNKQYRRNSASNVRVIIDEPIIEINLSRHYYKKQDSICSNNFISDSYQQYSKSQTYISNDKSNMYLIDPNDDIKKVLIYKDPKELSQFKSTNDDETFVKENNNKYQKERRPSVSLGIQIISKQISEYELQNEDQLGAIIASIEPDGLIDKFNVSINEGDEIVEICGVNVRNKSDSQIDEILDEGCKKNNGEIELLVRRGHSLRKKSEPKIEMNSNNSTDNNVFYTNNKQIESRHISSIQTIKNKQINNVKNDYDETRGFNEISFKKKSVKPREQLITDPAHFLKIKNKRNETQSRSFSPNINRPRIKLNQEPTEMNQINNLIKNENINRTNDQSNNNSHAFSETRRNIQNLRNNNSPVALDEFRALRDNKLNTKLLNNKASNDLNHNFELNDLENSNKLNRKLSDGSGYSNNCLSNSSSKEENSLFSYNSKNAPQQMNYLNSFINNFKQDEKSSGYNSNQSTPTSESNSLKNTNKLEVGTIVKSKSKHAFLGEILIQLSHDDVRNELIVRILKARNLVSKDSNGFSDPYCKLYLLPGRETENKRRTKTIFKSLNPIWNETFIYSNIYREEVYNKTLEFTLYDWDRFSRDDFLGIVKLDLKDPSYLDNTPRWFTLEDITNLNSIESDNSVLRAKRDFKSRLSFKRSKSLRKNS